MFFFRHPPPRVFLFSPSVSESKIPPRLHAQSFATWHPKQNCKQNFVRFSMMSWLLGEKNFKIHIYNIYIHMCLNLHISIFMCKKKEYICISYCSISIMHLFVLKVEKNKPGAENKWLMDATSALSETFATNVSTHLFPNANW